MSKGLSLPQQFLVQQHVSGVCEFAISLYFVIPQTMKYRMTGNLKFEVPSAAKYTLCPSEFLISYLLFVSKLVNAGKNVLDLILGKLVVNRGKSVISAKRKT